MQSPVLVLKDSLTRESGSKVHHQNIQASKGDQGKTKNQRTLKGVWLNSVMEKSRKSLRDFEFKVLPIVHRLRKSMK
uniref:T-complex protein 1 subunit gamma n=1 Tax=Tanacetum cinerariifolium TaxID=118510 RepID=A0A699GJM8_TANCI|nr:T-complex protein 1 subunit gamma [Tanacetum cinerariifolium]